MSSWVPSAAPLVETKSAANVNSDMTLDIQLIACLEEALAKRRDDATKADAPMPMGVGTSSFRTADRVDPATSIHEGGGDDEMEEMEREEIASDELSDDAVLGMMEDPEVADGFTDGSNDASGDGDDDNLTAFL